LTAAYELLERTGIKPIVLEQSNLLGGISRTVQYKGNRMDIGGHRFFSKSDRVMDWWMSILPVEAGAEGMQRLTYQRRTRDVNVPAPSQDGDKVMLLRPRKSRIYFMRKLFDYPLSLSYDTLSKLGVTAVVRIGFSYVRSVLFPVKPERTLEDFFVNRFGRRLYRTFFKSYTEKVWGVPCQEISAEWGAQRIKGLSIRKAIAHILRGSAGKNTETSLIEQFLYPKYGPGQMWEEVAYRVHSRGGEVLPNMRVVRIEHNGCRVVAVTAENTQTGEARTFAGDYFFSTMPIKELMEAWTPAPPECVHSVATGLIYRDFVTVGVLCRRLTLQDNQHAAKLIRDNWIYIQDPDVLCGRLQIFNNWSPYLVADPSTVWLGLEYFCYEYEEIWRMPDEEMIRLAVKELGMTGIAAAGDVLDATVIRMPKAYPAYFGAYTDFPKIREYVDDFENLFLVGRNGMHKYNNQDHSMLTAMVAVDNIAAGIKSKENLWAVNTEMEYHEGEESRRAGA
jgi:protoporphyrinogen oxidase